MFTILSATIECICNHYRIDMDIPVKDLPEDQMDKILNGSDGEKILFHYENDFGQVRENHIEFEGVIRNIERRYRIQVPIIFARLWKNI